MLLTGIASCAVILAAGRGVPLWRQWRDGVQQRLHVSIASLARVEAQLAARTLVAQRGQSARSQLVEADSMMLQGATAAAGAAQLAGIVGAVADSARAKLNSMQIRTDTSGRISMSRASVRLSAIVDIAGLVALLEELEGGAPLLVVRELTVAQGEPMSTDERPEQLRVDMVVEGMTHMTRPDAKRGSIRSAP